MKLDETEKLKTQITTLIKLIGDIKVNHFFLAGELITDDYNISHFKENAKLLDKKIKDVFEKIAND